ncbi:glycosyl hydrolase family 18 protein [Agilicoccus flavus]|uniref:glycosyl hydrolase family 18 protein n=1 Tax=Agilicoccus flavus TaxID=2775968 RepID=UPI001CF66C1A|nr:glycoside hydrolase family 18 protein [Agilicoccus flavus]
MTSPRVLRTKHVLIDVRDGRGRAFATALRRNATIGPKPLVLTAKRTFPAGTYRYQVGYQQGSKRIAVGPVRTFTVVTTLSGKRKPPAPVPAPQPARWVMGYYVGYLKDLQPLEAVEWDAMTHVAVGAAVARADGTLDTTFFHHDTATGRAWAKSVVDRAHQNGRKAILMLGGAGSRAAFASAASTTNRRAFVDNIISTVTALGFDGVDIDWEPMIAADGPNAISLGRELKARKPGLLLTIPIVPVNTNLPQNTVFPFLRDLAGVYDQVNVMSYGMTGGWEGWDSWHSSALFGDSTTTPMSVDASVRAFTAAGVPARKLGVGIGFFGSCMTGTTAPRQSGPDLRIVADDNVMSYANVMTRYYRPDIARWDDVAKVPYLSSSTPIGPAGCTYVTYENARSIAEKAAYVKAKGLGGAIVWNINEGHLPVSARSALIGTDVSIMSAVRTGFLG